MATSVLILFQVVHYPRRREDVYRNPTKRCADPDKGINYIRALESRDYAFGGATANAIAEGLW